MALPFFKWSKTAANNATADPTVNWAEGQAPSSVNDSARAMMASTAAFRDDISGSLTTAGTSTAYTLTTNQVFDSLGNMANAVIAFVPHATSGATVTLNVDSLGAKPLRAIPSLELPAGALTLGVPYTATYNGSDAVWYLHGVSANIGEFTSSTVLVGGAIGLVTGVAVDVTTISLTAGDWDVWGNVVYNVQTSTIMNTMFGGINTTTLTLPTLGNTGLATGTGFGNSGASLPSLSLTIPAVRASISATTTYRLIASLTFTAGTAAAYGSINARRQR